MTTDAQGPAQDTPQDNSAAVAAQRIAELEHKVARMGSALEIARSWETVREQVLNRLYRAIQRQDAPEELDTCAAWDRIVELVRTDMEDDQNLWCPEQEFNTVVTLTIEVTATVRARSEEKARELIDEAAWNAKVSTANPDVSDVDVDSVAIDDITFL